MNRLHYGGRPGLSLISTHIGSDAVAFKSIRKECVQLGEGVSTGSSEVIVDIGCATRYMQRPISLHMAV